MTDKLPYYVHCFTHLKRDAKNGGAPHKPVLLLSVIRLFEQHLITDNEIYITPDLVSIFKSVWSALVTSNHFPIFALPFYHMSSEPFWKLKANVGCEKWVESKSSMRSFSNLTTAVSHALIDGDLSEILLDNEKCQVLKLEIWISISLRQNACWNVWKITICRVIFYEKNLKHIEIELLS